MSVFSLQTAHLALEVLVFLDPAARIAHTLPGIAVRSCSLSSRLHSSLIDPLAERVVAICVREVTIFS